MHEEEKLESIPGNINPKSPSLVLIKHFILSPFNRITLFFLATMLPAPVSSSLLPLYCVHLPKQQLERKPHIEIIYLIYV